ncbi:MAG: aquaporin [Chloroflexi bacterium]|nr:aquaporin [Chloroflexota bacterium]
MPALAPALAAEALGTFIFFFVGAGAVVASQIPGVHTGLVEIALAHGLALAVMVSVFGPISGGHFNPAVTVGVWVAGKMSAGVGVAYIVAQLVGAAIAGLALRLVFLPTLWVPVQLGTPALGYGVGPLKGIGVEAILTIALLLAVFLTAIDERAPRSIAGFGIGMAVAADILVGGPLTGAAMNPARAFGPALASGFWEHHYVYWIGPIAGAVIAALLYRFLFATPVRSAR